MGINYLGQCLKRLTVNNGNEEFLTNTSLRRTAKTRLTEAGIPREVCNKKTGNNVTERNFCVYIILVLTLCIWGVCACRTYFWGRCCVHRQWGLWKENVPCAVSKSHGTGISRAWEHFCDTTREDVAYCYRAPWKTANKWPIVYISATVTRIHCLSPNDHSKHAGCSISTSRWRRSAGTPRRYTSFSHAHRHWDYQKWMPREDIIVIFFVKLYLVLPVYLIH